MKYAERAINALMAGNTAKFREQINTALKSKIVRAINKERPRVFEELPPAGERKFRSLHDIEFHDYPGGTENTFTSDMDKAVRRADNVGEDEEFDDPDSVAAKLKQISLNGTGFLSNTTDEYNSDRTAAGATLHPNTMMGDY